MIWSAIQSVTLSVIRSTDLVREPVRDPIRPGADFVDAVFRVTPRANTYT